MSVVDAVQDAIKRTTSTASATQIEGFKALREKLEKSGLMIQDRYEIPLISRMGKPPASFCSLRMVGRLKG